MTNGYQYSEASNPLDLEDSHGTRPSRRSIESQSASVRESLLGAENGLVHNDICVLDNASNTSGSPIKPADYDRPNRWEPATEQTGRTKPDSLEIESFQRPPETPKSFDWAGSWIWEGSGAILSAVCIGLMIGFLVYVDGIPYAGWQYSISPNAVVSIISAVAKDSMLVSVSACLGQLIWTQGHQNAKPLYHFQILDQASRGPWGALAVFWSIRSGLAIAGAMLTILSVALDPFAQQILAFPSREVVTYNETAYVQRAETYAPDWVSDSLASGIMDPAMQSALLTGLAGTNVPLNPDCSTAHCDYPDFATLGICTAREDVTEQTAQTCRRQGSHEEGWQYGLKGSRPKFASVLSNCTYLTPSGLRFAPQMLTFTASDDQLSIRHQPFTSIVRNLTDEHSIVSFTTVKYYKPLVYTSDNMSAVEEKPQFTECSVYLCERLYSQNRVSPHSHTVQPSKSQALSKDRSTWASARYPFHLIPKEGAATFANSSYSIDVFTYDNLALMKSLFHTMLVTPSSDDSDPEDSLRVGIRLSPILYASNNISESMRRMATSMTDTIRSMDQAIRVPGRAFQTQTYIHVRWPWIILPGLSVLFSILLFIAMVLAIRGQPVLWKSSVLPLMMGRLEIAPEHEIGHLRHSNQVQSIAEKVRVVVGEGDGGSLLFAER